MPLEFNFSAEKILGDKAYPSLAQWTAQPYTDDWHEFGEHWPYTVPVALYDYCQQHDFPIKVHDIRSAPKHSFYTIAPQTFNFDIDYIGLLPNLVMSNCRSHNNHTRLLFYYNEGDDPNPIKTRIEQLLRDYSLPLECYRFISANTAARDLERFEYFAAHELLFWQANQSQSPLQIHDRPRSKLFTVLNRTHKWWRATAMTDLLHRGLLDNCYWSYNTQIDISENKNSNSIMTGDIFDQYVDDFLSHGPYTCDSLSQSEHNNHAAVVTEHFQDSYCSIVFETFFDLGYSNGTFLTEKVFKCLKHGHPFVVVGCPGALAELRAMGYRTFDHAIDNSYDHVQDNTQRWLSIVKTIEKIRRQDMHVWFASCRSDIEHNQRLFCQSKYDRLNSLFTRILNNDQFLY